MSGDPPPPVPRDRTCGAQDVRDGRRYCREPGMWAAVIACEQEPHAVVYLCGGHRHGGLLIVCDHGIARVAYALLAGAV
jgi:hypothetical protein